MRATFKIQNSKSNAAICVITSTLFAALFMMRLFDVETERALQQSFFFFWPSSIIQPMKQLLVN